MKDVTHEHTMSHRRFVVQDSGAFPSLKNRADEMYTQGLAFEGIVYLEYAMPLGTRTGPDNYDSCLGNPLKASIHDSFNSNHICASTTRTLGI